MKSETVLQAATGALESLKSGHGSETLKKFGNHRIQTIRYGNHFKNFFYYWRICFDKVREKATNQKYSLLDLLKLRRMRIVSLSVAFNWFTVSLVFYGLALNVGNLSGELLIWPQTYFVI